MGCCGQTTTIGSGVTTLNPDKRVNYTKGMLLGVDDFVQEQAWGIARRHELARELIGYGTARGLKLGLSEDKRTISVSPGLAWTPSGQPVCVNSEQCADIVVWLGKNATEVRARVLGSPGLLDVYVTLAYEGVPTDKVPVPGDPCRSEESLMANSRIADCFKLSLTLSPPPQLEEDAIRDFADWLAQVPIDSGAPAQSEADFVKQVKAAAHDWLHHVSPAPADFMLGAPPDGMEVTDTLMRTALRLWATELRPLWRAKYGCCGSASADPSAELPKPGDDAVLLGRLSLRVFPATLDGTVDLIDESDRPVLLSLRMLQELITHNPAPEPADTVTEERSFGLVASAGVSSDHARGDHTHGTPTLPDLAGDVTGAITANSVVALRSHAIAVTAPAPNDVLAFTAASQWAPTPLPQAGSAPPEALVYGGSGTVGDDASFARSDHVHPLPALPAPPDLAGDASGPIANNTVKALQGVRVSDTLPTIGQVLQCRALPLAGPGPGPGPSRQPRLIWEPVDLPPAPTPTLPDLKGDVVGPIGKNTLEALQGKTVKAKDPAKGDVLTFDGEAWVPAANAAGGGPIEVVAAGLLTANFVDGEFKEGSIVGNPICKVISGSVDGRIARVSLSVQGVPKDQHTRHRAIVLLTPIQTNLKQVHQVFLSKPAVEDGEVIAFELTLLSDSDLISEEVMVQFQVSRFAPVRQP